MAALTLRGIRKRLGGNPVLRGVDLEVADRQLTVLVGPSGCGKSTLLRTIAGLEAPDEGSVHIDARDVTALAPRDRDVAMVFQSYALYPHLRVRDNLAFGLRLRRVAASTVAERVDEVAGLLGLEDLLERYPRQLSGGQRQRVAMGRAIARRPQLFLFDEPLSNLDAALRAEVRVEIKKLHATLGATAVYVTHDQVEAMTLADELVVLNAGKVEQVGPPLDIYRKPASRFVAAFMGSPAMNFIDAQLTEGRVRAAGVDVACRHTEQAGPVLAGVRPQDVTAAGTADANLEAAKANRTPPLLDDRGSITMTVEVVEAMGFEAYVHGRVGDAPFVARLDGHLADRIAPGQSLSLSVPADAVHLFDPKTELAL